MLGASLPDAQHALIDERKVTGYLLSTVHSGGRSKARFFQHLGFEPAGWLEFAAALREHAFNNPIVAIVDSAYGTRLVVDGILNSPSGRSAQVRVVWFIDRGTQTPRLVTAYPLRRSQR